LFLERSNTGASGVYALVNDPWGWGVGVGEKRREE